MLKGADCNVVKQVRGGDCHTGLLLRIATTSVNPRTMLMVDPTFSALYCSVNDGGDGVGTHLVIPSERGLSRDGVSPD